MVIGTDTELTIQIGTLVALLGFAIYHSAKFARYKQRTEDRLKEVESGLSKIESLDLASKLASIQTDLARIKEALSRRNG